MLNASASAECANTLTAVAARSALVIRARSGTAAIRQKPDGSPVTDADMAAEAAIGAELARLMPDLPMVSEEQDRHPAAGAGAYVLVDPLDGTREFIAGRDEYAINIALMVRGRPLLGVIAAPALGLIWRGIVGRGAERLTFGDDGALSRPEAIRVRPRPRHETVVVVSRSHLDADTKTYLNGLPGAKTIACGSAIKFCRVAEGAADLYPRLGPTRDWDVAAGHAIVEAAGGSVRAPDGAPLRYGTQALLIPGFVASASPGA